MSEELLRSFDYTENIRGSVCRPEKYSDLFSCIDHAHATNPVISRGSGLSYGAASMGEQTTSVLTKCFNRILGFDESLGTIQVEAGIQIGDLLSFSLSKGWILPVVPGHPAITVGGAVAFNVHGKNQFKVGCLENWIKELVVYHPHFGERRCGPDHEIGLFTLTVGGMGLTGAILSVTFQLEPLPSDQLKQEKILVHSLAEAAEVLKTHSASSDFMYSSHFWGKSRNLPAPGFVICQRWPATKESDRAGVKKLNSPYLPEKKIFEFSRFREFSPGPLRHASSRLFANANFLREKYATNQVNIDLWKALFPAQNLRFYFLLFPKGRFREFQAIIPMDHWPQFELAATKMMFELKLHSVMTSLKLFKGERKLLRYCETGISFSINFAPHPHEDKILHRLDELTLEHRAVPYLCKDSRMKSTDAEKIFPEYQYFKKQLLDLDPSQLFSSRLRRRLDV